MQNGTLYYTERHDELVSCMAVQERKAFKSFVSLGVRTHMVPGVCNDLVTLRLL